MDFLAGTSFNFNTPLTGIQKAQNSLNERAQRIGSGLQFSEQNTEARSLTEDIIGLKIDTYSVKANHAVIKVMDELQDSLLDVIA